MTWAYAHASVVGTSHLRSDSPCQDRCHCELLEGPDGSDLLLAIVSDGAGSASHGGEGAALACESFAATARELAAEGKLSGGGRELSRLWLSRFESEVEAVSTAEGLTARDYACTMLAAAIGVDFGIFVQIGDGVIVVGGEQPGSYSWVFWPQRGEYENQTNFATDVGALPNIQVEFVPSVIQSLCITTDGLQRLVLNYATRSVHAPFFDHMYRGFAGSEATPQAASQAASEAASQAASEAAPTGPPTAAQAVAPATAPMPGRREDLSALVAAFLASEKVNSRTDDDKTLVLAVRVAVGAS